MIFLFVCLFLNIAKCQNGCLTSSGSSLHETPSLFPKLFLSVLLRNSLDLVLREKTRTARISIWWLWLSLQSRHLHVFFNFACFIWQEHCEVGWWFHWLINYSTTCHVSVSDLIKPWGRCCAVSPDYRAASFPSGCQTHQNILSTSTIKNSSHFMTRSSRIIQNPTRRQDRHK